MRGWFGEQRLGRNRAELRRCPWVLLLGAPADDGEPSAETVHPSASPRRQVVVSPPTSHPGEQLLVVEQGFDDPA